MPSNQNICLQYFQTIVIVKMDCIKCTRKAIKYRCIGCKTPICDVCSTPCTSETPGYSEETYCVGKCDACQHGRKRKVSDDSTEGKVRQYSISSYFNKKPKTLITMEGHPKSPKSQPSHTVKNNESESPSIPSDKKPRAITVAAANRWNTTSLAKHMASEWLVLNADNTDYVQNLNCSVCKNYADKLKGMKNFSFVWAFTGSTNLRLSNAEDHAGGEPHRKAMDFHLKYMKGQSASERAEFLKSSNNTAQQSSQQSVTSGIKNMQSADFEKTKKKFETTYFIASQEMSLSKYPQILNLEEMHGVHIGTAYRNDKSCATFIEYIGKDLGRQLEKKLSAANFLKEAVFVQYLEKNPPGRDSIQINTAFLRLVL